jgi:branched-subunit amino acid transport protein
MSAAWVTILVLGVATMVIKIGPPLLLGGRRLPAPLTAVIGLLAPALLAALVLTETVGGPDHQVTLDARAAGLIAATAALAARRSLITAVVLAAAVTALVRAVG